MCRRRPSPCPDTTNTLGDNHIYPSAVWESWLARDSSFACRVILGVRHSHPPGAGGWETGGGRDKERGGAPPGTGPTPHQLPALRHLPRSGLEHLFEMLGEGSKVEDKRKSTNPAQLERMLSQPLSRGNSALGASNPITPEPQGLAQSSKESLLKSHLALEYALSQYRKEASQTRPGLPPLWRKSTQPEPTQLGHTGVHRGTQRAGAGDLIGQSSAPDVPQGEVHMQAAAGSLQFHAQSGGTPLHGGGTLTAAAPFLNRLFSAFAVLQGHTAMLPSEESPTLALNMGDTHTSGAPVLSRPPSALAALQGHTAMLPSQETPMLPLHGDGTHTTAAPVLTRPSSAHANRNPKSLSASAVSHDPDVNRSPIQGHLMSPSGLGPLSSQKGGSQSEGSLKAEDSHLADEYTLGLSRMEGFQTRPGVPPLGQKSTQPEPTQQGHTGIHSGTQRAGDGDLIGRSPAPDDPQGVVHVQAAAQSLQLHAQSGGTHGALGSGGTCIAPGSGGTHSTVQVPYLSVPLPMSPPSLNVPAQRSESVLGSSRRDGGTHTIAASVLNRPSSGLGAPQRHTASLQSQGSPTLAVNMGDIHMTDIPGLNRPSSTLAAPQGHTTSLPSQESPTLAVKMGDTHLTDAPVLNWPSSALARQGHNCGGTVPIQKISKRESKEKRGKRRKERKIKKEKRKPQKSRRLPTNGGGTNTTAVPILNRPSSVFATPQGHRATLPNQEFPRLPSNVGETNTTAAPVLITITPSSALATPQGHSATLPSQECPTQALNMGDTHTTSAPVPNRLSVALAAAQGHSGTLPSQESPTLTFQVDGTHTTAPQVLSNPSSALANRSPRILCASSVSHDPDVTQRHLQGHFMSRLSGQCPAAQTCPVTPADLQPQVLAQSAVQRGVPSQKDPSKQSLLESHLAYEYALGLSRMQGLQTRPGVPPQGQKSTQPKPTQHGHSGVQIDTQRAVAGDLIGWSLAPDVLQGVVPMQAAVLSLKLQTQSGETHGALGSGGAHSTVHVPYLSVPLPMSQPSLNYPAQRSESVLGISRRDGGTQTTGACAPVLNRPSYGLRPPQGHTATSPSQESARLPLHGDGTHTTGCRRGFRAPLQHLASGLTAPQGHMATLPRQESPTLPLHMGDTHMTDTLGLNKPSSALAAPEGHRYGSTPPILKKRKRKTEEKTNKEKDKEAKRKQTEEKEKKQQKSARLPINRDDTETTSALRTAKRHLEKMKNWRLDLY
eukprot:jgi/Botrbrau1/3358/Bobra.0048s0052.1